MTLNNSFEKSSVNSHEGQQDQNQHEYQHEHQCEHEHQNENNRKTIGKQYLQMLLKYRPFLPFFQNKGNISAKEEIRRTKDEKMTNNKCTAQHETSSSNIIQENQT